jgi:hypothetical protein
MKLKAVLQAQAVWFLRPTGSYGYLPKAVAQLRDKFQFLGVPKDEELLNPNSPASPITLRHGSSEIAGRTVVIDPLQIYTAGVLAGANTTTDDAEAFLNYPIEWLRKPFRLNIELLHSLVTAAS